MHYRVDPATNEVLEASVTDYIKKESGEVSKLHTTLYRWSYDEPYQAERNVMNEVLFSTDSKEDVCDLTTFYPVEEEENGWAMTLYRVAHGTRILFLDSADLALYADRELTKPIDFYLPPFPSSLRQGRWKRRQGRHADGRDARNAARGQRSVRTACKVRRRDREHSGHRPGRRGGLHRKIAVHGRGRQHDPHVLALQLYRQQRPGRG